MLLNEKITHNIDVACSYHCLNGGQKFYYSNSSYWSTWDISQSISACD